MLERPGYTSTDTDQIKMSWEMACRHEAELFPERDLGRINDGFLNHLAATLDRRFGTARSRPEPEVQTIARIIND